MASNIIIRSGKFLLRSRHEGKPRLRLLGVRDGETLVIKKRSALLFDKTHSVGFNRELIETMPCTRIRVELDSGEVLVTSKTYLLHEGVHDQYNPYEPQIFLPVEEFGLEKALEFERILKFKKSIITYDIYSGLGISRPEVKK